MFPKDLISLEYLTRDQIEKIWELAEKMKNRPQDFRQSLTGKTLGLLFQKPSTRTRLAFEVGMYQLGAHAIYLGPEDIQLGVREDLKDLARTLCRYLDAIVARTFDQEDVILLAKYSTVPVINGLSDLYHPCQALSDLFTLREKLCCPWNDIVFAYVGDGNNVLHSLIQICSLLKIPMRIAAPPGYEPGEKVIQMARQKGGEIQISHDPKKAVCGADVIYTDVWTSMGQEAEEKKRRKAFRNFQVNAQLVSLAKPTHVVMHCLPAHRREEISDEVLDGAHSIVFDQVENKLHVHKAILYLWLKGGSS